ncbi:phage tail protein [Parasphingorhabdus sp.]|uniref:GTA baseplate fiber-binding domain-containing protein n=1 Tax=Parasphingorhabdus sp. TaxID=2709688 RepID=UPI0032661F3A
MATLVLSAVGTAVGGPIGGTIGAIIGQQVDQNILFKPKGREGPRLQELAVQTSSYGSQVPRIYGKMRVAGTVIWATDLKETRSREGGGKGRPSTAIYSYSACFAVALSSREIKNIGRIWADGKIFRGAAGDFKTETGFAFHPGGEGQLVDGLMASAEATDGTPAYRGLALAVFEDMDLTEYGNRIPSLTFEVIADDGSVTIADVVRDVSGQRIALSSEETVIGYAAGGQDQQAALRPLTDSIPLSFSSDPVAIDRIGAEVRACADASSALTIGGDFVRMADRREAAAPERRTASVALAPRHVSIRYYDPLRDYQTGIQSALRPGTGRIALVQDFPAAISAEEAKKMAAVALWSEYDERSTLHVSVPMGSRSYRPNMLVEFDSFAGLWRIRECEIGLGIAQLLLTRASTSKNPASIDSEQGRIVSDSDLRAGLTRLVLVDLPFAIDMPTAVPDSPKLYAAAAGDSGWRSAQLFGLGSDDTPGEFIGQIPAPTIIGLTLGALDSANPALLDQVNHIDVELQNHSMVLTHANDSQLLAGRNIALIGMEIVQFSGALPLGHGRFRLSRLIRGLGGTEAAIDRHSSDEDFVLLDAASMLEVSSAVYSPFSPTTIYALGRDDLTPVAATIASPGRALMPWSPVHPTWNFLENGDLELGWTRRSRAGAIWPDHVEVPLAEEAEKYRIELAAEDGSVTPISLVSNVRKVTATSTQIQSLLLSDINHLNVKIHQTGAYGLSEALAFEISI